MDWLQLIKEVLIIVLPPLLAYIFGKWGIDQDKIAQHSRLLLIAKQAVLWAQDAFPDKSSWLSLLPVLCKIPSFLPHSFPDERNPRRSI